MLTGEWKVGSSGTKHFFRLDYRTPICGVDVIPHREYQLMDGPICKTCQKMVEDDAAKESKVKEFDTEDAPGFLVMLEEWLIHQAESARLSAVSISHQYQARKAMGEISTQLLTNSARVDGNADAYRVVKAMVSDYIRKNLEGEEE